MTTKLDALVAERVMGWRLVGRCWYSSTGHAVRDESDWAPAECIADAWRVVERLRTQDPPHALTMLDSDDGGYIVSFANRNDRWNAKSIQSHREVTLAICVAALRAVGVSEGEIQEAMR
jgi:hypothetical protein